MLIAAFFFWHLVFLTYTILISAVLVIAFFPRRRYTSYGTEQITKWKAFRLYLLDFSKISDSSVPSLAVWEHYLIYAVALGFADRAAKQFALADLPTQAPALPDFNGGTVAASADQKPIALLFKLRLVKLNCFNNYFSFSPRVTYRHFELLYGGEWLQIILAFAGLVYLIFMAWRYVRGKTRAAIIRS